MSTEQMREALDKAVTAMTALWDKKPNGDLVIDGAPISHVVAIQAAISASRAALTAPAAEVDAEWMKRARQYDDAAVESRQMHLTPSPHTLKPKPMAEQEIKDLLEAEFLGEAGKRNLQNDIRIIRAYERARCIK